MCRCLEESSGVYRLSRRRRSLCLLRCRSLIASGLPLSACSVSDWAVGSALPEWEGCNLHPALLGALSQQGFAKPTPIQRQAIPAASNSRDIVGIAETGSGKTLAYGLPILHHILTQRTTIPKERKLSALILAPTRELALQVSSHLNACLAQIESHRRGTGVDGANPPPLISAAALVGGLSAQKQRRILDRGVDILVATPGRLWDTIQDDDELAAQIRNLRFLVLDEADRMIETGHFAEMENILRLTLRETKGEVIEQDNDDEDNTSDGNNSLQTFIFSATMSKDLQRNVKKRSRPRMTKKKAPASTLDELLLRLDFRDPDPEIIDLSPQGGVVSTLVESKIECLADEKDAYLYYFLLRYPGRSLVFLSSIDGIRRMTPLLELLNLPVYPLHSQLEQRQRIKNLERFKSQPNTVLLATDIAARGLDIPSVDHVIHYQIPRTADTYVHRNGRTARASRNGFSLLLCAPDERKMVRALLTSLDRKDNEIPEIDVEHNLIDKLKTRVQLARKIDQSQHKVRKANHERKWMREAAEAMELELGSDFASDSDDEAPTMHKTKIMNSKTARLKAELQTLLAKPIYAKGVSAKYITSGSRLDIDKLMLGTANEAIVGAGGGEARQDITRVKKKVKPPVKAEQEEWGGITTTTE
ncbi:P-loop containing nucleoside triphosphate hydrolase protein [Pterulicium gracile]|uniref:RNA helicase n=1 Tax=Pterulicium gracile TaxID=1884261 RepID=A0A5C3QHX9_9AGAR|nr:P-loop containing nucleoside triphosphate hydrolase protein [Pterula gracilis]